MNGDQISLGTASVMVFVIMGLILHGE